MSIDAREALADPDLVQRFRATGLTSAEAVAAAKAVAALAAPAQQPACPNTSHCHPGHCDYPECVKTTQQAVAPGWKLVPVEPTEEMLAAAHEGDREYTLRNFGDVMTVQQGPYDHWAAMLAAAPAHLSHQTAQPACWVLTEQLEKRETTHRGYLWFSDPQNSSWTPLFRLSTHPQADQQAAQPLSDEQLVRLFVELNAPNVKAETPTEMFKIIVRAIEAAHGINDVAPEAAAEGKA
jgi:hypothetical protein